MDRISKGFLCYQSVNYLLWQNFYKIENEIRLWMLVRNLEWSIINSITSGENVTLYVIFQCSRWLKLSVYS